MITLSLHDVSYPDFRRSCYQNLKPRYSTKVWILLCLLKITFTSFFNPSSHFWGLHRIFSLQSTIFSKRPVFHYDKRTDLAVIFALPKRSANSFVELHTLCCKEMNAKLRFFRNANCAIFELFQIPKSIRRLLNFLLASSKSNPPKQILNKRNRGYSA